jgi:hypothetical protein
MHNSTAPTGQKSILDQITGFPDPAENYPPGSPEWSARVSLRIHHAVDRIQSNGVKPLVTALLYAVPHKPWLSFPEGHPYNDVDLYFKAITGMDRHGLYGMALSLDPNGTGQLDEIGIKGPTAMQQLHWAWKRASPKERAIFKTQISKD